MDTKLNIAKQQTDTSFRYKMPAIEITNEGAGFKSTIVNIVTIAKSLNRQVKDIISYMQKNLGTSIKYDAKKEKAYINGEFTKAQLQGHLQKFIEIFVLCQSCGLPETKFIVDKKKLKTDCSACGNIREIKEDGKINDMLVSELLRLEKMNKKNKAKEKKVDNYDNATNELIENNDLNID